MALPAPVVTRQASVQKTSEGASAAVVTRRGRAVNSQEVAHYQDWQNDARRYARNTGAVRFTAGVKSDVCARCLLRVEERNADGDWDETVDQAFTGIFDRYKSPLYEAPELVRLHAWHYGVAGEGLIVQRDGPDGVEWSIFSNAPGVADWNRPDAEHVTFNLIPGGKVTNETAFVVPRAQVVRFWIPDEEFQAFATSPMRAAIDDLRRYRTLGRYVDQTAESQIVLNGLLWAPGGPFEVTADGADQADETPSPANQQSPLETAYWNAAKLRFDEFSNDIAAIAPLLLHWDREEGPPQFIKIGQGLDQSTLDFRREALEDFARGNDVPSSMVIGGGPGDANHWTEWLVSAQFFDSAIAPTMNRVTHMDMTETWLRPLLRLAGRDPSRYRVGYDPAPVIVKSDQSAHALALYLAGLLNGARTLEAGNFDPADMMSDAEFAKVVDLASRGRTIISPTVGNPQYTQPVAPDAVGQSPATNGATARQGPPTAPVALASVLAAMMADADH